MKACARFIIEIWCKDLAYVDKIVTDNGVAKYRLVRQDLLERTVDAKGL